MNKIKEQIANNAKELIEGFVPSLYQKMATEWFNENYQEAKDGDRFYQVVTESSGMPTDEYSFCYGEDFFKGTPSKNELAEIEEKCKELFQENYDYYKEACEENREKHFTKNQFKTATDWQSYVVVYQVKNGEIVPTDYITIY